MKPRTDFHAAHGGVDDRRRLARPGVGGGHRSGDRAAHWRHHLVRQRRASRTLASARAARAWHGVSPCAAVARPANPDACGCARYSISRENRSAHPDSRDASPRTSCDPPREGARRRCRSRFGGKRAALSRSSSFMRSALGGLVRPLLPRKGGATGRRQIGRSDAQRERTRRASARAFHGYAASRYRWTIRASLRGTNRATETTPAQIRGLSRESRCPRSSRARVGVRAG
jgi:hypothetical protein